MIKNNSIICGDCLKVLKTLPDESINCVMTSPPYWALRDYGVKGQLGLEPTFQEYINKLCDIFDEIKRVLKKDGTCWVNIGDTYMGNSSYSEKGRQGYGNDKIGMMNKKLVKATDGEKYGTDETRLKCFGSNELKNKCLCQIPSRFAIEMTNRGWILRNEIIWHKPNCMPSSVKDRFTVDFEKLFFFTKSKKYYFEQQKEVANYDGRKKNILEPTRKYGNRNYHKNRVAVKNKRAVWSINTKPFSETHFAVYPKKLCVVPVRAGCPEKGIVLDPFFGAGTTGLVAQELNRNWIGIELNKEYIKIAENRLKQKPLF